MPRTARRDHIESNSYYPALSTDNMGAQTGNNLKPPIHEGRSGFRGLRAIIAFVLVSGPVDAQRQLVGDAGTAEGDFLKAMAPLDEPRGLCVDIPGHRDRDRVQAPLVVHTCKWNIWNLDERFDGQALARGELRMPAYNLCLGGLRGGRRREDSFGELRRRSVAAMDVRRQAPARRGGPEDVPDDRTRAIGSYPRGSPPAVAPRRTVRRAGAM